MGFRALSRPLLHSWHLFHKWIQARSGFLTRLLVHRYHNHYILPIVGWCGLRSWQTESYWTREVSCSGWVTCSAIELHCCVPNIKQKVTLSCSLFIIMSEHFENSKSESIGRLLNIITKQRFLTVLGRLWRMKRSYIIGKASRVDIGLRIHFWIYFLWLAYIGGHRCALIQANARGVRGGRLFLLTLLVAHLIIKPWDRDTDLLDLCWILFAVAHELFFFLNDTRRN